MKITHLLIAVTLAAGPHRLHGDDLGVEIGSDLFLDLADQYGGRVQYPPPVESRDSGAVVTLVVTADREGAPENRNWAAELALRYGSHIEGTAAPRLSIVPVAHLAGVPRLLRGLVKRGFTKAEPSGAPLPPIGLDWRGDVRRQIGLDPGVPNLAVLDTDGDLRLRCSGSVERAGGEVFRLLDQLLSSP